MEERISMFKESQHLIITNKEKCSFLAGESELNFNNIIDCLISLHIVLEVSLNSLFRNLSLLSMKKSIDQFKIIENIDNINFIDKTILFIYNSKFNFNGKLDKATEYHKIIGTMKDFSNIRNKLLHGHSISTIYEQEEKSDSSLKKNISLEYLGEQIKKFRIIMEGMRFYLDCLDSNLTEQGKEDLKKEFLNDDFLPHLITKLDKKLD